MLSDTEDEMAAASTSAVAPANVTPAPSWFNGECIDKRITMLKSRQAGMDTSSDDANDNKCFLSEITFWEEKAAKRKQKKEHEETFLRELQQLREAQENNKENMK